MVKRIDNPNQKPIIAAMKTKLGAVIEARNKSKFVEGVDQNVQNAIAAAFWAGQSDARMEERAANESIKNNLPKTRYYKLAAKISNLFNSRGINGLKEEKEELFSWDFEL